MDLKELAELISSSLGLKADVDGSEIVISDGKESVRAEPGYSLQGIALWVEPKKAWAVLRILYGEGSQVKRAYEEYKGLPYTTSGKVCWLHKALAKAVSQRVKGAEKARVLSWLEDQVYRRWPNVCGEVDALPEVTKLVTTLNSMGISSSVNLVDKDVELRVRGYKLLLKRRSPYSLLLAKELRRLAENERFEQLVKFLSGEVGGCKDLAEMMVLRKSLEGFPLVKHMLLERATELAERLVRLTKAPQGGSNDA